MANRNFPSSKQFSFHLLPVKVDGSITIGSAGAVSSFSAKGVASISHVGTGVYKITFQDNYYAFLGASFSRSSTAVTGSALDPHGLTVGTLYEITTVGNTNWYAAGLPSNVTPAVGQVFCLTAQPAAGTGRAKAYVPCSISDIQIAGNPNSGLINASPASGGGSVYILCQAATNSSTTTMIPTDPASGEIINFAMYLNNSSVQ